MFVTFDTWPTCCEMWGLYPSLGTFAIGGYRPSTLLTFAISWRVIAPTGFSVFGDCVSSGLVRIRTLYMVTGDTNGHGTVTHNELTEIQAFANLVAQFPAQDEAEADAAIAEQAVCGEEAPGMEKDWNSAERSARAQLL